MLYSLSKRRQNIPAGLIYTAKQYQALMKLVLVTSSISLFSSFAVVFSYLYLRISHPDKANRVSLHCVFFATFMDLLNTVFSIIIILIYGDTAICRTSIIFIMFSRIMSTNLLTIVGVNLVLVFVFHISCPAHKLERTYYLFAFIYALITLIIPIVKEANDSFSSEHLQCYYFIQYYRFGFGNLLWMSYYGFLFFVIVIAFACSTMALFKLLRENRMVIRKFVHIAATSQTVETANNTIQQRIKYQSNVFIRVVSRCIIYPLVPLLSNIWGFIFQIILTDTSTNTPNYPLALVDVTFKSLQGLFTAIVFFSDPAMTSFMNEQWKLCKQKYVDDYSQIREYSDGQIEIIPMSLSQDRIHHHQIDTLNQHREPISSRHSIIKMPLKARFHHIEDTYPIQHSQSITEGTNLYSTTIPMRRMSVPLSVYNSQIQHHYYNNRKESKQSTFISSDHSFMISPIHHGLAYLDESTSSTRESLPIITTNDYNKDENTAHGNIFVPYKHPRVASVLHWILIHCGFHNQKNIEEGGMLSDFILHHYNMDTNNNNNNNNSTIHFDNHTTANSSLSTIVHIPPSIHPLARINDDDDD
ncbi:uncharacterized protein BX663DRAFT_495279, partial [Cokeromyces recurvatus]|uniref:uncharacterized protein n=1 Tax=Cokeromyces recurvatus TaxID=90255 RepID=UPI00221F31A5